MKPKNSLLIIIISIILISCSNNHFESKKRFENNNWIKFDELEYNIPVEADHIYNFSGNIITDSSFKKRKIELGFYLILPSGSERLADLNFRILDFEYQPMGNKSDLGFIKEVSFRKDLMISEDGIIKLKIVQHSQHYNNYGIVGLDLFVTEK